MSKIRYMRFWKWQCLIVILLLGIYLYYDSIEMQSPLLLKFLIVCCYVVCVLISCILIKHKQYVRLGVLLAINILSSCICYIACGLLPFRSSYSQYLGSYTMVQSKQNNSFLWEYEILSNDNNMIAPFFNYCFVENEYTKKYNDSIEINQNRFNIILNLSYFDYDKWELHADDFGRIAKDLYDNFYSVSIPRKPNDTITVYIKSKQLPYKHVEDTVIFVRK